MALKEIWLLPDGWRNILVMTDRFSSLRTLEKRALSDYPVTRWRFLNDLAAAKIAALTYHVAVENESTDKTSF